ncbi:hypothetical protein QBC44DRAFT_98792 [Cladorrhinum sp. PSN332]|nr:hypothetical protein QBC44DRAFT_98792 [Cladorrhinum sp. PSN332]
MSAAQHQQNGSQSFSSGFSSPPPPVDLGAYARSMHQHTKRQMESINQSTRQNSGASTNGDCSYSSTTSSVPNGVSNQRCNPGDSFSSY